MSTVASVITSGRYDLRDTDSTRYEYPDAELLDYLNRSLVQLDAALSSLGSDWVQAEDTGTTLADGGESVSRPTRCIAVREVWIDDDELVKKDPSFIYYKRKFIDDEGQPDYFAEQGTNIIFEREADDDYALTIYYDQYSAALTALGDMPYDGQFDQPMRQAMVMIAKARNEYDVNLDAQLFDFFMSSAAAKAMKKTFRKKPYYLGF